MPVERSARDWLAAHARRVRGPLLLARAAGLAGGLCLVVQAGLFAWIVQDAVFEAAMPTVLLPLLIGMALAILARAGFQWLQETAGLEAGLRVRRAVRTELLDHIARLGPVRLADQHSAALAGQWLEQVEALHGYYARFLPQLWLAVGVPVLILVVVLSLDWLAALFLLLAAPLIPVFMALIGMGAERLNQRQFAALAQLSGQFLDRMRGLTTLQLFGHDEHSVQAIATASDDYRQRSMRVLRVAFLSSAVLEFFAAVAIAVIAIYIGFGLLGYIAFGPAPELTLYSGLFILLLAPEFFQPLRTLSQHYHDRATALGAAESLAALLARPQPLQPISDPVSPATLTGDELPDVALHTVTVVHPGRGRVLGPLDLHIAAGEFVALCGPSGAGKSTLLALVAGFIHPDTGRVAVADRTPNGSGFAWVDQRPLLIQGTIADNLRLAAPQADAAAMHAALQQAGLAQLLARLPLGLDTALGERGAGLSGGQAQRLALARVFLSAARLVLLDEPTSSLDRETERRVLAALERLAATGRTVLVATHHPQVMRLADRIVRLDQGRLIDA